MISPEHTFKLITTQKVVTRVETTFQHSYTFNDTFPSLKLTLFSCISPNYIQRHTAGD